MNETQGMRNQLHDCFLDIRGVKPSEEQIIIVAEEIPSFIKGLAQQWGWFDTEVREKLYLWLESKYSK
ncbi:hypothetical protein MHB77_31710 [Paenibacillus sp. FSL K6-3166]|uniref:hypothetical protein n=1 Tax=Paenibacillus sp. FSL K6-3166 TaxID=2921492 RepID=UPI001DC28DAA|nr:hypothetical protein [Acinetobacter sp. CUI P1]